MSGEGTVGAGGATEQRIEKDGLRPIARHSEQQGLWVL